MLKNLTRELGRFGNPHWLEAPVYQALPYISPPSSFLGKPPPPLSSHGNLGKTHILNFRLAPVHVFFRTRTTPLFSLSLFPPPFYHETFFMWDFLSVNWVGSHEPSFARSSCVSPQIPVRFFPEHQRLQLKPPGHFSPHHLFPGLFHFSRP